MLAIALLTAAITLLAATRWTRLQTPEKFPGDMYSRWYGLRELVFHGRNPYSPEVSREIQIAYYGRPLAENEHRDEQRFAYPVYVAVLIWPLLYLPFGVVRIVTAIGLFVAAMAGAVCWLKALHWRLSGEMLVAFLLLLACSFPLIEGVMLQQLGLAVGFFIALACLLMVRGQLVLAGVLLGLATIKPQVVLIPLLWLTVWTLSRWRERSGFLIGFASTMVVLLLTAQLLLPGWSWDFLHGISAYSRYGFRDPLIVTFAGQGAGWVGVGVICATVIALIFQYRSVSPTGPAFLYMMALSLCAAVTCSPALMPPFNQLLLLPAILILVRSWQHWTLPLTVAAVILLMSPSLVAVFLMAGSMERLKPIPIAMTLTLPLIVLAAMFTRKRILAIRH